jgi:uncharacterized protein with GYD domain
MAKYVVLLNWTDQGIRGAKQTVDRAQAARQAFEGMGVKLVDIWWTVGPYDLVCVLEAADDETVTRAGLALGMLGNVRSTTLRAFDAGEMTSILKGLP